MSQRRRGNSHRWGPIDEDISESEMENPTYRPNTQRTSARASRGRNSNARVSASQPTQIASTSRASQAASSSRPSASRASTSRPSTSRASQAAASTSRDNIDDTYAFSQGTQRASKLPEDEENNLISSVVKYMLIADRPKTLIQRANIIKAAMPNHSKHFKHIMIKVNTTLREVFGYNLVELEGSKYILTNTLDNHERHLNFSNSDKAEQVLLFIALSHIFMCDESGCKEDDLFDLFRNLDIIEDNDFKNEYFGDLKYLLTDKFVKQGYLDLVNIDKSDPPVQHYQWGVRAENELTPRHILEFMSKIFGGRPLNTWPAQFKIMQTREDLNRTL